MQVFLRNAVVAATLPATLAVAVAAAAASAATTPSVTVTPFERGAFDAAVGALHRAVVEDFESTIPGEMLDGLATAVGIFDTLGETGSGGTVSGTPDNTGRGVFVRNSSVFGRTNTTAGGDSYLDSNDTFGIGWAISGLGMFDRLFFTLSDVADNGAQFGFLANGTPVGPTISGRRNGTIDMVMLSFAKPVTSLTLELRNKRNDGFSIDDAAIGLSAPVPLPPAAALLAGGIAALALFRRRFV